MPAFIPAETSVAHAGKTIALDHSRGDLAFVSHAHTDHSAALGRRNPVLASEETVALYEARSGKAFQGELLYPQQLGQGQKNLLEETSIKLFEAGHVLGARQIFVEGGGKSFCYTGDFNALPSSCCPAAVPVECGELVVECTFGSPEYVFPEREELHRQIASWVQEGLDAGENVVLGGYSLGKAQELVKIVNELVGAAPLVDDSIARVSKVYSRFGCGLDFVEVGSSEAGRMLKHAFAAVLPMHSLTPQLAGSLQDFYKRPARTAVATGWALTNQFYGVDAAFPLSDHSDFPALEKFVLETGAKKVFCTHGFEKKFASHLRKKGVDAVPLGSAKNSLKTESEPQKKLLL